MARKAKAKKAKSSIFGTGWKGGSARKAIGSVLKKVAGKVKKAAKKGAKETLWGKKGK